MKFLRKLPNGICVKVVGELPTRSLEWSCTFRGSSALFGGVVVIVVGAEISWLLGNLSTRTLCLFMIVAVVAVAKKDNANNEDGRDTKSDYVRIAILLHEGHLQLNVRNGH